MTEASVSMFGIAARSSRTCPGHEERLREHASRIYSHPCPCGSGKTYGECCLERPNQEELEVKHRRYRGELICLDEDLRDE